MVHRSARRENENREKKNVTEVLQEAKKTTVETTIKTFATSEEEVHVKPEEETASCSTFLNLIQRFMLNIHKKRQKHSMDKFLALWKI